MDTERSPMSFREKSAWISFVLFVSVFGIYFWDIARIALGRSSIGGPTLFFAAIAVLIIGELVLHLAIAIRSPKDARTPKDERERLIELKATRVAFFVLIAGAFASIGTLHLRANRWEMAQCVLFSIIVAEIVNFGSQIVLYRRDA